MIMILEIVLILILGFSSSISNTVVYVLCIGGVVVIIGLSIYFRQLCLRKLRSLCWKTIIGGRIASHRNENDDFKIQFLELERQDSIFNSIDEHHTIAGFGHLNQRMYSDENHMYDYPFN